MRSGENETTPPSFARATRDPQIGDLSATHLDFLPLLPRGALTLFIASSLLSLLSQLLNYDWTRIEGL